MKIILIALALIAGIWIGGIAHASIPCDQVRAGVAQYGLRAAIAWARQQGYSEADIRRARSCLR